MATFRERGGRWQARVRLEGFSPVTRTFIRKADAVAWSRSVEADMQAGRWIEDAESVPTMREAVDRYEATVGRRHKGAKVAAFRFAQVRREPWAGKPVDKVTPRDLADWRDRLGATLKPGSVGRMLSLVSSVFTWAVKEQGWCDSNPVSMVRKPRVQDGRDRVLTAVEMDRLMVEARASRARWLAPVIVLLSRSAMRRGEVAGLRVQDLDFTSRTAYLPDTKNGSARLVPLCPGSLAAARQLADAAAARGSDALLPVGSAPSISTRFKVVLGRARAQYVRDCEAAGVVPAPGVLCGIRVHDLRHHALTAWATTGELSAVDLMAISGHRSPRQLGRYLHVGAAGIAAKLARITAAA